MNHDQTIDYKVLKCILSEEGDQHISEAPVILKCGHTVCEKCLKFKVNSVDAVECIICETTKHENNLNYDKNEFKNAFNKNLSELFHKIHNEFDNKLEYCRKLVLNATESLTANIEFVKEEVQIRIESIKNDLDMLNVRFEEELNEVLKRWERNNNTMNEFEKDLCYFNSLISNCDAHNEKHFYECQNKLRDLNKEITNYKNKILNVEFIPNKLEIDRKCVGQLQLTTNIFHNLNNRIRNDKYKILNVKNGKHVNLVSDCCTLSNGNLLLTDTFNRVLLLYNSKFELIKKIKSIEESYSYIEAFGLDCNFYDEIYLSVWNSNSIVKVDQNLKFLTKTVGRLGNIDGPVGICCYSSYIYVCSVNNKLVLKYRSNLEFHSQYKCNYTAWYIKIINDVACIRSGSLAPCIYFHDINNSFMELRKYEGHNGPLGIFCSHFFEASSSSSTIYCYNFEGELKYEMKTNSIKEFRDSENGSIAFYNSNLIICNKEKHFLISI